MYLTKPHSVLVCLVFLLMIFTGDAPAWDFKQAAAPDQQEDFTAPPTPRTKAPAKIAAKKIVKCRPPVGRYGPDEAVFDSLASIGASDCVLPITRPRGWELDGEALFARTKGKVRLYRGFAAVQGYDDVDMNADLGLPDHNTIGTFSARYRFKPRWSLRYSIMPFAIEGSGSVGRNITFGSTTLNTGGTTKVKWERIYQRLGLVYDPIRTYSARVSVFGDYVRLNEKLSVIQVGCCGDTMDNDLNMGMAGVEFEKCLKTSRLCSTLSLDCRAGVAFGEEGYGSDVSTGLKYSIPMNSGRWGYVKGGYRYVTYKKKYSEARMIDTATDGGFLQMGFVF
jgi:hypothetical protein